MSATRKQRCEAPLTLYLVRSQARLTQVAAATLAGVTVQTLRVFELNPYSIRNLEKREALWNAYREMRRDILATIDARHRAYLQRLNGAFST